MNEELVKNAFLCQIHQPKQLCARARQPNYGDARILKGSVIVKHFHCHKSNTIFKHVAFFAMQCLLLWVLSLVMTHISRKR